MLKLLRADFYRALRFKIFYLALAVNAVVAVGCILNMLSYARFGPYGAYNVLLQGMGGGFGYVGILSSVAVSIFIGHEFSCGAMRNRVIAGSGRARIYLSKLIVSAAMCVCIYLVYHLLNFTLGSALLGWNGYSFADAFLPFLAGLFMTLAYAAVFTAVAMYTKSTVAGLLIGIIGSLAVSMFSSVIMMGLSSRVDMLPNGDFVEYPCDWHPFVQWLARTFVQLMPSGQAYLMTAYGGAEYGLYIGLSCCWAVLSAAGGSLLFRKVPLK